MLENTAYPGRRPAPRSLRILLAFFLILGAAAGMSLTPQQSAHAATTVDCTPYTDANGYWHVAYGCTERIPVAHHCKQVGTSDDGTSQGVECADVVVKNSTEAAMWGEGEFYCQGVHTQCLGMNVTVWEDLTSLPGNAVNTGETKNKSVYQCNGSNPTCPTGTGITGGAQIGTPHINAYGPCFYVLVYEPADGAVVSTSTGNYTTSQVILVNGASQASHATDWNYSNAVNVCLGS